MGRSSAISHELRAIGDFEYRGEGSGEPGRKGDYSQDIFQSLPTDRISEGTGEGTVPTLVAGYVQYSLPV